MKRWVLLLCAVLLGSPVFALDIEGVTLPGERLQGEEVLVLNGAGVRSKWFLDLYVASLYLETPQSNASRIINDDHPFLLRLDIISGLITSEKMENATREGFDKAAAAGYPAPIEQVDAFIDVFRETINEGDAFELSYRPESGVSVSKNGVSKATLSGFDFRKALLAIWLGPEPAQKSLRQELLGAQH